MQEHLYDTDSIQEAVIEYGRADSEEVKDRIEEEVGTLALDEAYPDKVPEQGFPRGTPLLASLLKLHREIDDEWVRETIEDEILAIRQGIMPVAEFELRPKPYASRLDLPPYIEYYAERDEAVCRYFRLRLFEELGAFADKGLLRVKDTKDGLVEGLSESEREYLQKIPV